MSKRNILIVDDEPTQCKMMKKFVTNLGHNAFVMNSGMEVVDFFTSKKVLDNLTYNDIDVMLLDLSMPDIDGLTVLKKIDNVKSDVQIIVLTATSDVTLAVNAINLGATDYIIKGGSDIHARLTSSIKNAIDKKNLKYQVSNLVRKDQNQVVFSDVIGQSKIMLSIIDLAKRAVNIAIPILVEGQNGCGKELLARAIHGSGMRVGKPFIVVECDMMKPEMAEEDLFGLERVVGAKPKIGKIREAEGGTIFLKKIEVLNLEVQTKLLRFLQDKEFHPTDSHKLVKSNVRLIASTSKDLAKLATEKKFREDLRYALSIFPIQIPSLQKRGDEDIIMLAEHFLRSFTVNENKKIKSFKPETIELLCKSDWKDNVRQLKNFIFRAVILCDDEVLYPEHFPQLLNAQNNYANDKMDDATRKKLGMRSFYTVEIFDENNNCKPLADIEEEISKKLMDKYSGNISEVAKQLSIARSTLYRKLRMEEGQILQEQQSEE
ncbi:MAG TPA: sigma-54 dependent transcriptional regulator [Rickettsiales bacterium]|nr:sigma-54 dependent transcriptional regulator [Rickettsiales bacterium]